MTDAEKRALVTLWSFRGVGAHGLARLERLVPRADWLSLRPDEAADLLELTDAARARLLACRSLQQRADEQYAALEKLGQRVCFRGDGVYPARLAGVRGAPPLLYFTGPGDVGEPRARVAIVGTRHTSREWLAWTASFAHTCVEQGLVVASGAAEGVDTAAHTGALNGRGVTWAFVASGLDQLDAAPKEIVQKLLPRGGTVFSEYPPGARADKGLFVQRNRLISGSSDAVVVVRGKADSGARHTAEAAKTQGRVVLAVPGSPLERGAELCQALLRDGARPCFEVKDVLGALGLTGMSSPPLQVERGEVSAEASAIFAALPQGLFDIERAVAAVPSASSGAVAAALMELELAGWVSARSGRRYEKPP